MQTRTRKFIVHLTLQCFLLEILMPAQRAFALTGGPNQPDFSSFEPVGTTNMVNPLTGQFTYNLPVLNIPGPNGSGYALSLSYHAGASPEEEASWVGYGWTLNPGSITRNKRGFPDDFNGESIRYWNKTTRNWTVTAGYNSNIELFSQEPWIDAVGLSASIRYNNYKGFGYVAGVTASVKGLTTLGYSVENGEGSFSHGIGPGTILSQLNLGMQLPTDAGLLASIHHGIGNRFMQLIQSRIESYARYSVANEVRPTTFYDYTGMSFNVGYSVMIPAGVLPIGVTGGFRGSYSYQQPANEGINVRKAYGYMYSSKAEDGEMMDYYVEKETPYTKRERFLSVPFSNADFYSVTGQAMSGGFRLYNKKPGQFRPNATHSEVDIVNVGFQGHVGPLNIGVGANIGVGRQSLDIEPWLDGDNSFKFAGESDGDEPYFFRMNNDPGGHVLFADDDDATQADMTGGGFWGFQSYDVNLDGNEIWTMNRGRRSGRSTYVRYLTYSELGEGPYDDGWFPNYLTDGVDTHGGVGYYNETPDRIAEFSLINSEGMRYTYGLPVYARKEKNLQYGLKELNDVTIDQNQYLARAKVTAPYSGVVVGEEQDALYATSYLLTGITTPDYVDRELDGPTADDLGGYTEFTYHRTAGEGVNYQQLNVNPYSGGGQPPGSNQSVSARVRRTPPRSVADPTSWANPNLLEINDYDVNKWYKWRVPYLGLLYKKNSLSDAKDDMGAFSMGEREVYYLSTIETKSHVAVFVTNGGNAVHGKFFPGSGVHRKDGYEAMHNEALSTSLDVSFRPQFFTQHANQLRRLERIELWSKNPSGGLSKNIQTVKFEYDTSICMGLPNSYAATGKLTLKRVYMEYNGVVNAKITPYVFGYEYRTSSDYANLPVEVQDKYEDILSYADNWDAAAQNPTYKPFHVGRWGFYQYDGENRHRKMNPWIDQNPPSTFDPAAWQLKWIRLPSGGEIHIQYEQTDYSYVQDHVAMLMVNLTGGILDEGEGDNYQKYYLDLEGTCGIANGSEEQKKIKDAMIELFLKQRERICFRVIHALDFNPADIDGDDVELLTGYASVVDVGIDEGSPGLTDDKLYVKLASGGGNSTPRDLAEDFVKTNRAGIIHQREVGDNGNEVDRVRSLIGKVGSVFFNSTLLTTWEDSDAIDWENSYMRIPIGTPDNIVRPKKGGGIRVKRLLMYDPGLETGAAHLFGSEYLYETENGSSSGVASNEPGEGREENALVRTLDKRVDQAWLERVIAGRDKEQFEGPIGESLLPAPAVMHSRVVMKNIHTGRTNPGFTINEYYTSRDHPFQCIYDQEDVDNGNATPVERKTDLLSIPTPFFIYNKANIWATQGYRFVLNDMSGQVKKVATYGGNYDDPSERWIESSSQEYIYFSPGEKVPMLYEYSTEPEYVLEDAGKEMEVAFEGRSISDVTVDLAGKIDGSLSWPPIPTLVFVSASGNLTYSESKLRTHVTCKVVRYPSIVKKVESRQDGITHITENIGFSPITGQPVVTRTTDGYAGLALQYSNGALNPGTTPHNRSYKVFSYPATQEYREMGQMAGNERAHVVSSTGSLSINKRFDPATETHYLSFSYPGVGKVCSADDFLTAGDMIQLYTPNSGNFDLTATWGLYHVDRIVGNTAVLQVFSGWLPTYFIDNIAFRIVRSGRTNQLLVPRAGISVYTD